jgi:hypothetical protein
MEPEVEKLTFACDSGFSIGPSDNNGNLLTDQVRYIANEVENLAPARAVPKINGDLHNPMGVKGGGRERNR